LYIIFRNGSNRAQPPGVLLPCLPVLLEWRNL
jgi:hypothetical protein